MGEVPLVSVRYQTSVVRMSAYAGADAAAGRADHATGAAHRRYQAAPYTEKRSANPQSVSQADTRPNKEG